MILEFDVCEQAVTAQGNGKLINRSVEYVKLEFTFKGTTWNSLEKHIQFYGRGADVYDLELENDDTVIVPAQVLRDDYFIFSLYGLGTNSRVTCNQMKIYLGASGFVDNGVGPGGDAKTVIDRVYDAIDSVSDDVTELDGTVSDLSDTVSGINTSVGGLGDELASVKGRVSIAENNIVSLDGTIDGLSDDMADVKSRVGTLETGVSGLDGTVDSLSDTVSSLSGTVDGLGDDVTTINGKLNNTVQMDVKFADGTTASYDVVVKE